MFFPVGDTNIEKGHKPVLTYLFIAINVAIFIYQFLMPPQMQVAFIYEYGSIPIKLLKGQDLITLITCQFLHGGWMHLIGNMLFLWIFADNIEATIGTVKFMLFYIGGGIVATLAHTFFNPTSVIPCVGASGAIAACLGAYVVMFPHSRIRILFLLFLTTFSVRSIFFLGFWIVQQFMAGIGSIGTTTTDTAGVAYWAHIGGFIFGVICGFAYRGDGKRDLRNDH